MATAVAFDFPNRKEWAVSVPDIGECCAQGHYCWADCDVAAERDLALGLLAQLGTEKDLVDSMLNDAVGGQHAAHGDLVYFTVDAPSFEGDATTSRLVEVLLGPSFLLTFRRGETPFLKEVGRTYREDFLRYAVSPGFLLYEFWDHLVASYRRSTRALGDRVREVQDAIFGRVDDVIFERVAEISRDLLSVRRSVLAAREVLSELATRRSVSVPESTRPFLDRLVGSLERIGADLTVERETLAETLNLYMGVVSHRTNRVVNRLTVVSLVFLPLTFLCGVYGMNFEFLPEFKWRYGYAYFWVSSALIASGTLVFMKKRGWW